MTLEQARKKLPFLLFDELDFEEENEVSRLLAEHAELREELERLREMFSAIQDTSTDPPPGLLSQCRSRLHASMREDCGTATVPKPTSRSRWFPEWLVNGWNWQAAGTMAMVLMAFLIGRWSLDRRTPVQTATPTFAVLTGSVTSTPYDEDGWAPRIRNIRTNADGTLQIEIEDVKQRLIEGSPDDREVRAALLNAAQNTLDPSLRGGTIDLLRAQCDRPDVRDVLLHVVRKDTNPNVRMKALEGLAGYPDEVRVREALRDVLLRDQNPAVRMEAVNLLVREQGRPEVIGLLQEVMQQEENLSVRERCQHVLTGMNASTTTF